LVNDLVALGGAVLPGHPAGESFTQAHDFHQMVNGCPPAFRAQKFPVMMVLVLVGLV
jgi:hypothetical protein